LLIKKFRYFVWKVSDFASFKVINTKITLLWLATPCNLADRFKFSEKHTYSTTRCQLIENNNLLANGLECLWEINQTNNINAASAAKYRQL
jgi:hypothetical protein